MRLSLRWKIAGGFGVLVVLILALSWVTFSLFGSLRSVQRKVFDDALPGLVAVDEIVRSYTAQSAAIGWYLIGSQATLLSQYRVEVDVADFWEDRAENLFGARDERQLLDQLITAGSSFNALVDKDIVPRAAEGDRSQAFRLLSQEGTPLIAEIERLGILLRDNQRDVVAATQESVRNRSNQTVLILLLVTIAIGLLGVFLAIVLPRRLVANISRLVDAARAIGRGDLDQELDIRSGDEVEELAVRFGEMQSGLKRLQQLALQDRELEIAASIQRNLLQRSLPDIVGVVLGPLQRQANLVGGDWYDVDAAGQTLTVAVGDASGKGIGAALMATVALSALRAERASGATRARSLGRSTRRSGMPPIRIRSRRCCTSPSGVIRVRSPSSTWATRLPSSCGRRRAPPAGAAATTSRGHAIERWDGSRIPATRRPISDSSPVTASSYSPTGSSRPSPPRGRCSASTASPRRWNASPASQPRRSPRSWSGRSSPSQPVSSMTTSRCS